ncbi:DUF6507 family protein [Arthrobacter sp. zg-Y1110]|uniref:DUF6507 family protein n=1 Tax=Arthrobacter sp. zg-Y1110 TaxID=2886932 RepID=UPI001D1382E4|nr:DUF6507 family protein [Arthrobacter sp. zg-Y1110]MCC3291264.1 DUF6507 family protein [Arthrobacter sp. zg-Y1110]UWX83690.1 DUF6507 family protein [Arthrobacter sp. zg-Y1110]
MKFDLSGQSTAPVSGTTPGGTADGNFEVAPDAVIAILNEVQTMAVEFNDLLMAADASMVSLADACKAPPIATELATFSIMMQKRTIRSAGGRTMVAVDAVADATLALVQGDKQMSDTAREAAAMAAQQHVDDAPGAANGPSYVRHGSPQAF